MPLQEPSIQEKGFRTSVLGFDKNDVLAYMNALANETQQRELELQQTIDQLNTQLDKLKKDQTNARACVEKLQQELNQANARAEAAEKAGSDAVTKLADAESRAAALQSKLKDCQQAGYEWQFRCRDLQKQVDEMEAMIPKGGMPAARKPEPEPAPAPAETPAPAPVPPPATPVDLQARIEARKILADARLSAETAERRLREEAETQRARMAEHAEALAAGVQLLRDRLARVDDRLNSASMDLENATGAIYQALDDTKRDLDALGDDLRTFGRETAPAVPAQPPAPARQAEPPRAKATPRRVRPVRPERPQPSAPANDPAKRLRRTARSQRPVSQELGDALRRLDKPNK